MNKRYYMSRNDQPSKHRLLSFVQQSSHPIQGAIEEAVFRREFFFIDERSSERVSLVSFEWEPVTIAGVGRRFIGERLGKRRGSYREPLQA